MASHRLLLLLIFSIFYTINAQIQIYLPVNKDPLTLQYITQIHYGFQLKPRNFLIDLSAPFTSIVTDSPVKSIPSCSIQCSIAKPFHLEGKNGCFTKTQTPNSSCDISVANGITRLATKGELAGDLIAVRSKSGTQLTKVADFIFARAPNALLSGLASGVEGILGFGKSPIGFPSQIAAKLDFNHDKFVTCLSSSNGFISIGILGTNDNPILSKLSYTNLVNYPDVNPRDYFISVRSIKISGKRVALGQGGIFRTRVSTTVPYTTLESSIYGVFKRAYVKAANFMNLTRVISMPPFDLCFRSNGVGIEPSVFPSIDLVLQSEMVTWRVGSMVKLGDGVLDGGLDSKSSIVIGGFELEDRLLEFDLGRNMLGFSLPLSLRQASCSDFGFEVKESL